MNARASDAVIQTATAIAHQAEGEPVLLALLALRDERLVWL